MLSNRLAFVALAIACMGAAAGGGYLATRQNTVPTPASAETRSAAAAPAVSPAAPATTASSPATPVRETEAIVGDAPPARPSQKAAAAKAADTPARPVARDTRTPAPLVARQDVPAVATTPALQP